MKSRTLHCCLLVVACFFGVTTGVSEDLVQNKQLLSELKPVVGEIEATMLGKPHRPLDEFVASDAIFEEPDSSLIGYLKRLDERLADDGPREFPTGSRLYWMLVKDSSLARMFGRYAKLEKNKSMLVFRELSRKNGQLKAIGYVLQKSNESWKVVFAFEGSGPEDQLSKNAVPFADGP